LTEENYAEQPLYRTPPRYTEATLVKALEEQGLAGLHLCRDHVDDPGARIRRETRRTFSSDRVGKNLNDLLIEGGFDDLFNVTYTARMEEQLDNVEEGKLKWTDALHDFYGKFQGDLDKFKKYTMK